MVRGWKDWAKETQEPDNGVTEHQKGNQCQRPSEQRAETQQPVLLTLSWISWQRDGQWGRQTEMRAQREHNSERELHPRGAHMKEIMCTCSQQGTPLHKAQTTQVTGIIFPLSIFWCQSLKTSQSTSQYLACFVPKNTHKSFLTRFCSHLSWKHPFPFLFSSTFITGWQQDYRRLWSLLKYQADKHSKSAGEIRFLQCLGLGLWFFFFPFGELLGFGMGF